MVEDQNIAYFRVWLGAYSRGRLFNNLVSRVGAYSRVGAHSWVRLINALGEVKK